MEFIYEELKIAASHFGCGVVMATVQSAPALGFGMVGSMGALSPIGYIIPGIMMPARFLSLDLAKWYVQYSRCHLCRTERKLYLFHLQSIGV